MTTEPLITETDARRALERSPVRWERWWDPVLILVLVVVPTALVLAVTGSDGIALVVAVGSFVVVGAPLLLFARQARSRLAEENVVHELVPGQLRECATPGRGRRLLVIDLDDGRQVRTSPTHPFAELSVEPGAPVWVANPATGWRSRVVFVGPHGRPVVAHLLSRSTERSAQPAV